MSRTPTAKQKPAKQKLTKLTTKIKIHSTPPAPSPDVLLAEPKILGQCNSVAGSYKDVTFVLPTHLCSNIYHVLFPSAIELFSNLYERASDKKITFLSLQQNLFFFPQGCKLSLTFIFSKQCKYFCSEL